MSTEASKQASATLELGNTSKRDFLKQIEADLQQKWLKEGTFNVDSPSSKDNTLDTLTPSQLREKYPKYFATFPYAYMNGSLHLGHAFTVSKVDFVIGFERLQGRRTLFPCGFHCTGMPIKASSDKLIREIEMFGENFDQNIEQQQDSTSTSTNQKSKIAAKTGGVKYQYQIMENIGVPRQEIKKFADPNYWLTYFPPIAKQDLSSFGARIDWRRSFITTDANPYYDSFVRWQITKLYNQGHIGYGKRYTIYSPKDGQPCMDHDRASGENVGPQEYTGLKIKVLEFPQANKQELSSIVGDRDVYFVAATLRPETMYGQTNCFVGPKVTYSIVQGPNNSCYIISHRAARNMAYQGLLKTSDKVETLGEVKGSDLVGTLIQPPLSVHQQVYILPMETVSATKGTAVVTSVPSDSPDDYATYADLRKKPEHFGIDPSWTTVDPVPVLKTPTYGDMTAEALIKKFKINSHKDIKPLAEAKEIAYKEGFYQGIMVIGKYTGQTVQEAKDKVKKDLIDAGDAFVYAEPESQVISRSADECVVALCDQWFMKYGTQDWRPRAEKLVNQMELYSTEVRNQFMHVLSWMHEWACARSYGLGSKFPIDPQFLVESLSDSTIYMSYYTINHLLHGDSIDGSTTGPLGIKPEQMTDAVWDYVFGPEDQDDTKLPTENFPISTEQAQALRREFTYFYPMDLRSSGKDLIPNHLTMCVYVHSALFSEEWWPRSMRANGHLMLNSAKMSKSTGNFLTLQNAVEKFGADATRIAIADAGDGIEDANFEEANANAAILRLRTLIDWCEEIVKQKDTFRQGPPTSFWDKAFNAEIDSAIIKTKDAFTRTNFKEALKYGFYELQVSRDLYREATNSQDQGGMNCDLLLRWIKIQALLILPVAPHFSEYVWSSVLGQTESIHHARFPEPSGPLDKAVLDSKDYVIDTLKNCRETEGTLIKKKNKAKGKPNEGEFFDANKPKSLHLFIAKNYPEWQDTSVAIMKDLYNNNGSIDNKALKEEITKKGLIKNKKVMPFCVEFQKRIAAFGAEEAFDRLVAFDEKEVLTSVKPFLKKSLNVQNITIEWVEEIQDKVDKEQGYDEALVSMATPRNPSCSFYNEKQ